MRTINIKPINSIHGQRAFTLLEVLVSLVIFAFVMVGLGRLMISTVETNRDARRITAATNLAMDQVERMRAASLTFAGYNAIASSNDGPFTEEGVVDKNGIYSRRWAIARDTPEIGSTRVAIQVTWGVKKLTDTVDADKAIADSSTTSTDYSRSIMIQSILVEPTF